ncbi:MAG: zinc ribbon domain-containing protein [Candidatus Methanomethylophilaceae archaeon]
MRRNLTVTSLSVSLFFVGLSTMAYYYPNQVTLSVLGINITNNLAIYMGSTAALLFAIIALGAALMSPRRAYLDNLDACCDHSYMDGCISGIYHDEATGTMVCLNCGTGLKQDFVACPTCGQEIYQECPACKEVVPTWYNVCPYCGYDFIVFEISALEEEAPAAEQEALATEE